MGELLQEAGVSYSRGPGGGLHRYSYVGFRLVDMASTKGIVYCSCREDFEKLLKPSTKGIVYCSCREDFEKLLKHWNRDVRWAYEESEWSSIEKRFYEESEWKRIWEE